MAHKLFIVEGADGTGKSTLCNALMEATKGHLLHASYEKNWNIPVYHEMMYKAALDLLDYQPVIFDRWAVSEQVYSTAFRNGPEYLADDFMQKVMGNNELYHKPEDNVFIYCSNDKAIENHEENKKLRDEMFDDMSPVVKAYSDYMKNTKVNWIQYDFTKVNMNEFVKEITK